MQAQAELLLAPVPHRGSTTMVHCLEPSPPDAAVAQLVRPAAEHSAPHRQLASPANALAEAEPPVSPPEPEPYELPQVGALVAGDLQRSVDRGE